MEECSAINAFKDQNFCERHQGWMVWEETWVQFGIESSLMLGLLANRKYVEIENISKCKLLDI
jgi:hypothetical protein